MTPWLPIGDRKDFFFYRPIFFPAPACAAVFLRPGFLRRGCWTRPGALTPAQSHGWPALFLFVSVATRDGPPR